MRRFLLVIVGVLFVAACASSRVSQTLTKPYQGPKIKTFTISPGGGVLGEAVAVELFNRGYTVIDSDQAARLLGKNDLTEFELASVPSLETLQSKGVDAVLAVKTAAAADGLPQSASARITSTKTHEVIAAVSWQNGWGGQKDSIADRTMRKDVAEAAKEIVNSLQKTLH
jgi:hypothetical protein